MYICVCVCVGVYVYVCACMYICVYVCVSQLRQIKNLCGRREPSDYISLRRTVKRQQFRTLKKRDTKSRTTFPYLLTNRYLLVNIALFPPERSI